MPAAPEDLFARLDELGVAHRTVRHPPIFTVGEGAPLKADLPGGHSKNLFLKDKNGALFLVCALGETQIRLNQLHKALGCARLSFGREEALSQALGVRPGSVTLFALINDPGRRVTLVLDDALLACDLVNFHPLSNDATTTVSRAGMLRFVAAWGGPAWRADFAVDPPRVARLHPADFAPT